VEFSSEALDLSADVLYGLNMRGVSFIVRIAGLLMTLVGGVHASTNVPNVILIMADDMGYECVSANGSLTYQTPRLDDLAARGIRFNHCYSTPICTTSRVVLMTGRYSQSSYEAFTYLNPGWYTFGHLFKDAGYRTCMAGKWQLNGTAYNLPGWNDLSRPQRAGFDETCVWNVTVSGQSRYADPVLSINGGALQTHTNAYGPEVLNDFVLDFIDRHHSQPFFVYYPMVLPHAPFVPTPDSPASSNTRVEYFNDMVTYLDDMVGNIVDRVDGLGIAEDTIVLFIADNGTDADIVGQQTTYGVVDGGKTMLTDAGTRVPMIVWWKGHTATGSVSDVLISLADFVPTFADAICQTNTAHLELDGHSFHDLLAGEPGFVPRDHTFVHYDARWFLGHEYRGRFARTQRYKLYETGDVLRSGQLFDVLNDPLENFPLEPPYSTEEDAARQHLLAALSAQAPMNLGYNTFYPAWREASFTPAELLNMEISGDEADPDMDGKNNFYEYLTGTPPLVADATTNFSGYFDSSDVFALLRLNRAANGYKVVLERSADLVVWEEWGESTEQAILRPGRLDGHSIEYSMELPDDDAEGYIRMRFSPFKPMN